MSNSTRKAPGGPVGETIGGLAAGAGAGMVVVGGQAGGGGIDVMVYIRLDKFADG